MIDCFDSIHGRYGKTVTARRHRQRLCVASRGRKNQSSWKLHTSKNRSVSGAMSKIPVFRDLSRSWMAGTGGRRLCV